MTPGEASRGPGLDHGRWERLSNDMQVGLCFMPMHWNELWAEGASVNEVTSPQCDPLSKQPALKCCAVRVEALASALPAQET